LILRAPKIASQNVGLEYSQAMAVNWTEVAQKMAQAARAGVVIEKKRLQEILAERQKKSASPTR
jgi:hypothetical protein